jgi:hypothetical protein
LEQLRPAQYSGLWSQNLAQIYFTLKKITTKQQKTTKDRKKKGERTHSTLFQMVRDEARANIKDTYQEISRYFPRFLTTYEQIVNK